MLDHYDLTVSSDLANLARIADFVAGAALQLGLTEQQVFEVQMATDEACANVIQHAYGPGVPGELHVRCELAGGDFVVTIRDRGRPFDPRQVPPPDLTCPLEERQIGGLGLYFMGQLMDRVVFRSDPQTGNELKMYKRRSP
ncbi:MAG TPA: ATP-binding protein [Anaerolineae bacterium]|nr:ATP-binding protein [Anaerolineae bacterium]HOR00103.1 ATP-binding protein [Anaerolineae bacterium]HPL27941.1 ATP-binding protein [Anaerolineae bacterium]